MSVTVSALKFFVPGILTVSFPVSACSLGIKTSGGLLGTLTVSTFSTPLVFLSAQWDRPSLFVAFGQLSGFSYYSRGAPYFSGITVLLFAFFYGTLDSFVMVVLWILRFSFLEWCGGPFGSTYGWWCTVAHGRFFLLLVGSGTCYLTQFDQLGYFV